MEKHMVKRADYPDMSDLDTNFQEQFHILSQQLGEAQYQYMLEVRNTVAAEGKGEGLEEDWPGNPPVPPETPKLESEVDIQAQVADILHNPVTGPQTETEGPLSTPKESPSPPAAKDPRRIWVGGPLTIVAPGIGRIVITVTPEMFAKYEALEKAQQVLEDLGTTSQAQRQARGDEYIGREIGSMGAQGWIFAGFTTIEDAYGPPIDFFIFAKSDVRNTGPFEYKQVNGTEVITKLDELKKRLAQDIDPSENPSQTARVLIDREITRQRPQLMEEALVSILSEQEKEGWYSLVMLATALIFIRNA